ncbi:bactofilin family protein [Kushneria indalinina]|uniref:Polymer-forming protein n=1 Tax=Kushneria indalinina DSM 14324 TaxID=1122140 RepID=A0A3D9DTG1_9GAMM|nr:polymer-forming cytoskeletal protein [Kushneria indalinina]REC94058.1 polymer-forming protein [Kushneria indalinina DSM 14324]
MNTLGWLLIVGIAAILLILYDGQRRARRARLRDHRIDVATAEPLARPLPSPVVDRAEDRIEPAPSLPSHAGTDAAQQNRHGPAGNETVHSGSFIGPSIHVIGHVEAAQPLTVAGRVEGEITLRDHGLAILGSGEAGPNVQVCHLVVDGRLSGAVHTTQSATFYANARFEGKLKAGRLRCVEGATLSGQFSIG